MLVQIYEVSKIEEAKRLADLGVDHIGVLVGKGQFPRELSYQAANEIFGSLPKGTKRVALTLAENLNEISEFLKEVKCDILHIGTYLEKVSPQETQKLKKEFPNVKIMRAIPVIDEKSVEAAKSYDGIADFLLLDTFKNNIIGASGSVHNWDISKKIVDSVQIPVILAGGLGADNVAEAIQKVNPAGVDSKTKTDITNTHEKDIEKVREFILKAKQE